MDESGVVPGGWPTFPFLFLYAPFQLGVSRPCAVFARVGGGWPTFSRLRHRLPHLSWLFERWAPPQKSVHR
jgi:hypothetical protein